MTMESSELELTVEDILNIHRPYITKLYVDDRKTEAEIVAVLHERHLEVTLSQIQKCIRDWDLVQVSQSSPATNSSLSVEYSSTPDGWELISSPQPPASSSTPRTAPYPSFTPTTPPFQDMYRKRALPPIPTQTSNSKSNKRKSLASSQSSTTERLKLTCHHGPGPSEFHEVQTTLDTLHESCGPSPLELYTEDVFEQGHERIAVGLERVPSYSDLMPKGRREFRRAHDIMGGTRTLRGVVRSKRAKRRGRRDATDSADGDREVEKKEKEKEKEMEKGEH